MDRRRQRGITLIEIMISLIVIGILIAVAVPNFQAWMQNVQIRTASEALLNGLQNARNEAIRRNVAVQLQMGPLPETGWAINLKSDPDGTPLQTRQHAEGSINAAVTTTPGGSTTVTFSALGRVEANADGSPTLTQIDIDNPTMNPAESRQLRIVVPVGGGLRLCDPQVAAGDPRAC